MSRMFDIQNKIRSGAYINFKAVSTTEMNINGRNVMTMPVELDWGPSNEIFEITSESLANGSCEKLIGINLTDAKSLVFRQALSNCATALIYRLNGTGGAKAYYDEKASGEITLYTYQAKYIGLAGNDISVKVIENEGKNTLYDVVTYYREVEKDRQVVSKNKTIRKLKRDGEFKANDWLDVIVEEKQPDAVMSGEGYVISCEANPETYLGEDGNNLKISYDYNSATNIYTIKIQDDEMTVYSFPIKGDTAFTADDFPANKYVIWREATTGSLTSKASSDITYFNKVKDAKFALQAGAHLVLGMNGNAYSSQTAKAKYGNLQATSLVEGEAGNAYGFTIEQESNLAEIQKELGISNSNSNSNDVNPTAPKFVQQPTTVYPSQAGKTFKFKIALTTESKQTYEMVACPESDFSQLFGLYKGKNVKVNSFKLVEDYYEGEMTLPDVLEVKVPPIYLSLTGKKFVKTKGEEGVFQEVHILQAVGMVKEQPAVEFDYDVLQEPSTTEKFSREIHVKLLTEDYHFEQQYQSGWGIDYPKSGAVEFERTAVEEKQITFKITFPNGIKDGDYVILHNTSTGWVLDKDNQPVVCTFQHIVAIGYQDYPKPANCWLEAEPQLILDTEESKTFDIVVNLAGDTTRFKLNDNATSKSNFGIDESFKMNSITKVSDTQLKFNIEYLKDLPYPKTLNIFLEVLGAEIAQDTILEETATLWGYTLLLAVRSLKYDNSLYKIVINKFVSNETVKTINKLPANSTIQELNEEHKLDNEYIKFDGNGFLELTTEVVRLTGGSAKVPNYTAEHGYFDLIKNYIWNTMCLPQEDGKDKTIPLAIKRQAVNYVRDLRDKQGKKCQIVLYNYGGDSCNYEGVISTRQGYKTAEEEVNAGEFTAYVAGITAGASIYQSNTFKQVEDAKDIIYYNEQPYTNSEIENLLRKGYFLLSKRTDLSIVCEKDINTIHDPYPQDTNYSFSKNRVIRTLDEINNNIKSVWEKQFVGKVSNNKKGRELYRATLIRYFRQLETVEAIQNFNVADITVEQGEHVDAVVVELAVQPTDSMEVLYCQISID